MTALERLEDESKIRGWIMAAHYLPQTGLWTLHFGPRDSERTASDVDIEACAEIIERDIFRSVTFAMAHKET